MQELNRKGNWLTISLLVLGSGLFTSPVFVTCVDSTKWFFCLMLLLVIFYLHGFCVAPSSFYEKWFHSKHHNLSSWSMFSAYVLCCFFIFLGEGTGSLRTVHVGFSSALKYEFSSYCSMAEVTEQPFRPREKLIEKQKFYQSIHKHTYLKGPYDKITSVAIPVALASTCLFLIVSINLILVLWRTLQRQLEFYSICISWAYLK